MDMTPEVQKEVAMKYRVTITSIPNDTVIITRDFVSRQAAAKYMKFATRMNSKSKITTIKE